MMTLDHTTPLKVYARHLHRPTQQPDSTHEPKQMLHLTWSSIFRKA